VHIAFIEQEKGATTRPGDHSKVAVRLSEDFTTPARPRIREAMIALRERYPEEELVIIVDWVECVGHTLEVLIAESDRTT